MGTGLSAGHGGIDEPDAPVPGKAVELTRYVCGRRRVVDHDRALTHSGKDAVITEGDASQVIVIADAGKHDLGTGRSLARSRGLRTTMVLDPGRGLFGGTVVNGDVMPAGLQMPGHVISHDAKADEGNLGHNVRPPEYAAERWVAESAAS